MPLPCYRSREEIARQLHGDGLEFGPGCHPLSLGPHVTSIRYCDVHDREAFAESFPEVAAEELARFPSRVDVRLDFDKEPFADVIGERSLDFVVANHVLEHVVNPIRFLVEARRTLRGDGLIYLALPDMRRTFDRDRQRTPFRDVVARHEAGASELDEARIIEWARTVDRIDGFGPDSPGYADVIEGHRRRSIHVNVWLIDDVIEILTYLARAIGAPLALIDGMIGSGEMILVLRNDTRPEVVDHYPVALQRILAESHYAHAEAAVAARLDQQQQLLVTALKALRVGSELAERP